ncbi:MAG: hypothetical protein JWR19_316 [Pedosphaera sp.]|nr:hypothetical protein [Pedosphaera sp.]
MPKKSVFCIATSEAQAIEIVQQLKAANFSPQDISVLLPDKQGSRDFAHVQQTKAPEGVAAGVSAGGVLGGALGWLAGIGALAIPGVGPLIAAGPVMAALSGAAVGAAVGGITGALVGMGIPEYEAKRYEGKIKSGNILISVHSESGREADKAREIFERAGAQDIASSGEAAVKGRGSKGAEAETAQTKPRAARGKAGSGNGGNAGQASASGGARQDGSEPTPEEISARAYQIYLSKGRPVGQDRENWLEAEAQLRAERKRGATAGKR